MTYEKKAKQVSLWAFGPYIRISYKFQHVEILARYTDSHMSLDTLYFVLQPL